MAGVTVYPMSTGKTLPGSSQSYSDRNSATLRGVAYKEVGVNPLLKSVEIISENGIATNTGYVASANFFEVRTSAHHTGVANDASDKIGNRIMPKNQTLTSYCTNVETTPPFKVKVYDSTLNSSETNRTLIYGSTDYPNSDEVGIDIDTYDYFILINPEITTAGNDTIRPHFAKITRLAAFDNFGDGVEFTPKYPTSIPQGTKFEIFKGPHKTNDADVVAVSYGLRGDTLTSSPKYDTEHVLSQPTTYFYKDRLDVDGQLDYGMKYNLTVLRWWSKDTSIIVSSRQAHDAWDAGAANKKFTVLNSDQNDKIHVGQSIFDHTGAYLGNVESKDTSTTFYLDYARQAIGADGSQRTYTLGRSIRNVVFVTETKFGSTVSNLAQNRLDATLVDLNKNSDEDTGTSFNCNRWQNAFPNYYRNSLNHIGATSSADEDGNLTGPQLYITFEKAQYKNDKIPQIQGVTLNSPKNKISKMVSLESLDTSGLQHLKIKEEDKLIISNQIYNSNFKRIAVRGTVSRATVPESTGVLSTGNWNANYQTGPFGFDGADATTVYSVGETMYDDTGTAVGVIASIVPHNQGHKNITFEANNAVAIANNENMKRVYTEKFILSDITKETDLRHNLAANDIVEIDGYYYVIDTISAPNHSDGTQIFTVKDKKLISANTWSGDKAAPQVSKKTLYLMPYTNGVLNLDLKIDTEVDYATSRLTMNGHRIDKEDTRLNKARLVIGKYSSLQNKIEYGDKDNKFLKMNNANATYYQVGGAGHISKFYYFGGSYGISDDVFVGEVEDITSESKFGMTTYKINGRDETSRLLSSTINKNLNHYNDIVKTCIAPNLSNIVSLGGGTITASFGSRNITWSGTLSEAPAYNTMLLNQDNKLIGFVRQCTGTDNSSLIELMDYPHHIPTALKYYNHWTQANKITGAKALMSNPLHTTGIRDYSAISERGVTFDTGYTMATSGSGLTTDYHPIKLESTSNRSVRDSWMPSFPNTKTLGFDISNPSGTKTTLSPPTLGEDSLYSFFLSDETGAVSTNIDRTILNSETFDVIELDEKDDGSTTMKVAPRFPVVLGRIDTNTSDARGNCNFYFVNSNIDTGGFIHRISNNPRYTGQPPAPSETFRYWDFQKFKSGTLTKSFKSIYNQGKRPQQLQGYAVGYSITADGVKTASAPTATPNNRPINGSNTLKGWTHLSEFYSASKLPESYTVYDGGTTEFDIKWDALEQIDPRTDTYEMLGLGDIAINSKLHQHHMCKSSNSASYADLGVVLESEPLKSDTVTEHQEYDGATEQTLTTDNNFENNNITDSYGASPSDVRRWGIIRLVEATFDWHFNPVKFEDLPHPDEIPTVPYFDYVMFSDPTVETSTNSITLSKGSDVNVTANTVTETDGDMFYSLAKIGTNPSSTDTRTTTKVDSNGFIAVKKTSAWGSADSGNHNLRSLGGSESYTGLLRFNGYAASGTGSSKIYSYGVNHFALYRTTAHNIDGIDTKVSGNATSFKGDMFSGKRDIRFTNVWLTRERTRTNLFEFGNLKKGSYAYDAPNVILPLISQERDWRFDDNAANDDHSRTVSLWHPPARWLGQGGSLWSDNQLHMSRVVNSLIDYVRSDSQGFSLTKKYGLGITSGSSTHAAHPYDGAIGVFRNLNLGMTDDDDVFKLPTSMSSPSSVTSSPLQLDTDANYQAYIDEIGTSGTDYEKLDQHTRTAMLQPYDPNDDDTNARIVMGGTRTTGKLLSGKSDYETSTSYTDTHQDLGGTGKQGLCASAQMLVKPVFWLNEASMTSSYNSSLKHTTLVFTLNENTKHLWLSFMPNLTNYYMVSEKTSTASATLADVTIRSSKNSVVPAYIFKIISHSVSQTPSSSNVEKHTIVIDGELPNTAHGYHYRLMKIDESTFVGQKDFIEFNVMKRIEPAAHFLTGETDSNEDFQYQESVYYMHLLVDTDINMSKLERRGGYSHSQGFTNGQRMEIHFTDGDNSYVKQVTVSTKRPVIEDASFAFESTTTVSTESGLIWKFDGELWGNGVVSASKTVDLKLAKRPQLKNPTKCHIGTTYSINAQVKNEVENIVKTAGLEYDHDTSFVTPTGNLVNSSTSTSVVCQSDVVGLANGDVIYTHDGHLIGKITNISGATITISKRYYTPSQHDEITLIDNKTVISALKFDNTNVYSTLNSLLIQKGMDYKVKDGKVIVRDIEDTKHLRVAGLSYAESDKLISVNSNKSLFDKANRIILIGDRVTHTVEKPTKKQTREIRVVDPTIKTKTEAELRASELLSLHSDEARKISIEIQKEGLELLEAGDIVRLDFPNHNIPAGDYIIFEIENVLAGTLKMTVGTFDKTIAERLSEINLQQGDTGTTLFKRNTVEVTAGKFLFDEMNINVVGVAYEITGSSNALSYNSNMGFDDLVGFTEEVGFEHSTVTKKSYGGKFYEQETYGGK